MNRRAVDVVADHADVQAWCRHSGKTEAKDKFTEQNSGTIRYSQLMGVSTLE